MQNATQIQQLRNGPCHSYAWASNSMYVFKFIPAVHSGALHAILFHATWAATPAHAQEFYSSNPTWAATPAHAQELSVMLAHNAGHQSMSQNIDKPMICMRKEDQMLDCSIMSSQSQIRQPEDSNYAFGLGGAMRMQCFRCLCIARRLRSALRGHSRLPNTRRTKPAKITS